LVNQNGFYNQFIEQTEYMRSEMFIPTDEKYKPFIVKDIHQCMELIKLSNKNS